MERIPYRPTYDNLLVRLDPEQAVTANGIHLPEKLRSGAKKGTVVAAGPGRIDRNGNLVPLRILPGTRVAFGEFAGKSQLPVDPENPRGEQYSVIAEHDILGVLEEPTEAYFGHMLSAARSLGIGQKFEDKLRDLPPDSTNWKVTEELTRLFEVAILERLEITRPAHSFKDAQA